MTTAPPLRDRSECDALIRQYRPLVFHVLGKLRYTAVRHLDRDEAEARGLIALWKAARSWREDGGANFSTFAHVCVKRGLLTAARTPKRPGPVTVSMDGMDGYNPTAKQADRDGWLNGDDLRKAMPSLDARSRRVLELLYLDELPTADVARALRITRSRVLQIRDLALRDLRDLLTEEPETTEPQSPLEALSMLQQNPSAQPPGALLTIEQVAQRLGVAKRSIWRWVEQGILPAPLKLSATCRRWRAEQLEEFLNRLERQASV